VSTGDLRAAFRARRHPVGYSLWFARPSSIRPRSAAAFGIAILSAVVALALRLLAGLIDWQVPAWPTFFLATMIATAWAGVSAGVLTATLGLALSVIALAPHQPQSFSAGAILFYALASAAIIAVANQFRALLNALDEDRRSLEQHVELIGAERAVLDMIAADRPLRETMAQLTRSIEQIATHEVLASVLFVADGVVRHGAAPSLPAAYTKAVDGTPIGPSAGSCGTAAWRREPVYVTDIETDPLWDDYRHLLAGHGLHACWSTPILSQSGDILGTFALYHREKRGPRPRELEVVNMLVRTAAIAIERDHGRVQTELLLRELSHRVKNVLAVVQSIASSTLRKHVSTAHFEDFEKRLVALARSQDLLTRPRQGVEIRDLIRHCAIAPFGAEGSRFELIGPSAALAPQPALALALALHELCTNAAKYGALSNEDGHVIVRWGYEGADDCDFVFQWRESGGPPVKPTGKSGFGLKMIERALTSAAHGKARVDLHPEGLSCELRLPREKIGNR